MSAACWAALLSAHKQRSRPAPAPATISPASCLAPQPESLSSLKKRLAEAKARQAAEEDAAFEDAAKDKGKDGSAVPIEAERFFSQEVRGKQMLLMCVHVVYAGRGGGGGG